MKILHLACIAALVLPVSAKACDADTDCRIGDRIYRIALPSVLPAGEKIGAIVFAHGYGGRAAQTMKHKGLRALADDLGIALIAVQSADDDWSIPGAPSHSTDAGVDELAYFDDVVEDAATRFAIDRRRLLATGFSAGGMMVWNLACFRGGLFAGFAPMSGTFWQPVPQTCPGAPVNLFHFHGTRDAIVPIEGRAIDDAAQGDIRVAADMLLREGGYGTESETVNKDGTECRSASASDKKTGAVKLFDLCLHDGKHVFKTDFVRRSWLRLREIGAL